MTSYFNWRRYVSKRWWLLGGLALMLCGMAAMEYYWIEEIIRAEHQRAMVVLNASLHGLRADFDFEVTRAVEVFAQGPAGEEEYSARYAQWRRHAPYPNVLLGLYAVETGPAGPLLKPIAPDSPMPAGATWKADIANLARLGSPTAPACSEWGGRKSASAAEGRSVTQGVPTPTGAASGIGVVGWSAHTGGGPLLGIGANPGSAFRLGWGIALDGNPAFALSLTRGAPLPQRAAVGFAGNSGFMFSQVCESTTTGRSAPSDPPRWALAIFDANYLATSLLPELLRRHFPGGYVLDFQMQVIEGTGATPARVVFPSDHPPARDVFLHPDAQVDLFSPRLECIAPPLGPHLAPVAGTPRAPGAFNLQELLTREPSSCQIDPALQVSGPAGLWRLQAIRRPQSSERAMSTFRRRSVLVSFGVLIVLGLGMCTLVVLAERASALAEMRTELILGISHELRTPLTVIRVAADNLKRGMATNGEQTQEYGEIIGLQARRLSDMVEDGLMLARMQSSQRPLDTAPTSAESLSRSALAACEHALNDAGFEVDVHIAADVPLLDVDARLIGKCLENLVQNAIRYAVTGHWIALRANAVDGPDGGRVRLSVEDRGPGIVAADLPYVFDPFYRGRDAAAASAAGLGLGLTFVKRVVEAHRGSVEVRVSNTGTEFSLLLPCHRTPT